MFGRPAGHPWRPRALSPLDQRGLTLVELMIAVALSGFVIAALFMTFRVQSKSANVQDRVAAMQQNVRASFYLLTREIRIAGYDPAGNSGAGFTTATASTISMTMDLNGDGDVLDTDENVSYLLYTDADGIQKLGRRAPAATRPVAENIQYLEFLYILADGTQTLAPTDLTVISQVRISLLANSGQVDQGYINTNTYTTASGVNIATALTGNPTFNDGLRRRLYLVTVACRNMGLT